MKYKTRRKYYIYRERSTLLINKSAFVLKICHVTVLDTVVEQIESREIWNQRRKKKEEGRKEGRKEGKEKKRTEE